MPYSLEIHPFSGQKRSNFVIEVRPRAGSWSPFFAAIPINEKEKVVLDILHGPRGRIPMNGGLLFMGGDTPSVDGKWYMLFAQNEATPSQSYFVFCKELPSKLYFGVMNGKPQYLVDLPK